MFVIVAPEVFLNCNPVPPTVEIEVKFTNWGLPLSLSPSKAVEKPATVWEI